MFKSYDSFEEMMADIQRNREAADRAVTEAQAALTVGDCFMRFDEPSGLVIYGEILDPGKPAAPYDKNVSEEELAEYEYEAKVWKQPHMENIRFCRCFSRVDPWCAEQGELGNVHVATMAVKLSREAFEAMREAGWPNDPTGKEQAALLVERGISR